MEREKILSLGVGFENMAKIIGGRWKALGDEERAPYKARAVVSFSTYRRDLYFHFCVVVRLTVLSFVYLYPSQIETERYKKEMTAYRQRGDSVTYDRRKNEMYRR
jgi:hypothetical protein